MDKPKKVFVVDLLQAAEVDKHKKALVVYLLRAVVVLKLSELEVPLLNTT